MNYWIVRGKRSENPFAEMRPGALKTWQTGRPPKLWIPGDRLMFWASSPDKCIIALGTLETVAKRKSKGVATLFVVKYLTPILENTISMDELRQHPLVKQASFLKLGPPQTVLRLTDDQAESMYRMVVEKNPQYAVWSDLSRAGTTDLVAYLDREQGTVQPTVFEPTDVVDARKRLLASIVQRRGQPEFRRALLKAYMGKCAVTGYNAPDALEAAHIIKYCGPKTNHITNGLLLRADIHTLLDLNLISVDADTMTLLISPTLKDTNYSELAGQTLFIPYNEAFRPNKEALEQHRREAGL